VEHYAAKRGEVHRRRCVLRMKQRPKWISRLAAIVGLAILTGCASVPHSCESHYPLPTADDLAGAWVGQISDEKGGDVSLRLELKTNGTGFFAYTRLTEYMPSLPGNIPSGAEPFVDFHRVASWRLDGQRLTFRLAFVESIPGDLDLRGFVTPWRLHMKMANLEHTWHTDFALQRETYCDQADKAMRNRILKYTETQQSAAPLPRAPQTEHSEGER